MLTQFIAPAYVRFIAGFLLALAAFSWAGNGVQADGSVAPIKKPEPTLPLKNVKKPNISQCVETDQIDRYTVEDDQTVRLFLKTGDQQIMLLARHCPQLQFHGYFSYTPVDGKLCASTGKIKTRAGLLCQIKRFTPAPEHTVAQKE